MGASGYTGTPGRPRLANVEGIKSDGRRMITVLIENEPARTYPQAYYTLLPGWVKISFNDGLNEMMWPSDRVMQVSTERG